MGWKSIVEIFKYRIVNFVGTVNINLNDIFNGIKPKNPKWIPFNQNMVISSYIRNYVNNSSINNDILSTESYVEYYDIENPKKLFTDMPTTNDKNVPDEQYLKPLYDLNGKYYTITVPSSKCTILWGMIPQYKTTGTASLKANGNIVNTLTGTSYGYAGGRVYKNIELIIKDSDSIVLSVEVNSNTKYAGIAQIEYYPIKKSDVQSYNLLIDEIK